LPDASIPVVPGQLGSLGGNLVSFQDNLSGGAIFRQIFRSEAVAEDT